MMCDGFGELAVWPAAREPPAALAWNVDAYAAEVGATPVRPWTGR
jgi:hypothetical protein